MSIPTYLHEEEHYIYSRYTCDGADVSLPVRWSGMPSGAAELALFIVNLRPVHHKLFFDWAVAGLSPSLNAFAAGELPPGAIVGRNSFGNAGYSICPPKSGRPEHFLVQVAALRGPVRAKQGFDASSLYREAEHGALLVDYGGGVYKR